MLCDKFVVGMTEPDLRITSAKVQQVDLTIELADKYCSDLVLMYSQHGLICQSIAKVVTML